MLLCGLLSCKVSTLRLGTVGVVCRRACVSEQEKCGGQRPVFRGSSGLMYLILEQGLSLSLEITDEASLAASEPRGPTSPWFPYPGGH